jgi:integrase
MAKVLTQLAVERLKPPAKGRVVHWDALVPGFGLRISASGARSWIAMFRVNGRAVMATIGSMSAIPKVDDARKLAREAILVAKTGVNPVELARAEKIEVETTVSAVIDRYLREHVDRHVGTAWGREVHRMLEREVLPHWGDRPIRGITRRDVNSLLDRKSNEGHLTQANRIFDAVRGLFHWARAHDMVDELPTTGVRPGKKVERDRVLTDAEIVRFWAGCDSLEWPFGPMFKLLLLTAQRRDEIGQLRWAEVDIKHRRLIIAGARMKNTLVHETHLSPLALEIFEALPRFAGADLVFVGRTGVTAVSGFSRAKSQLDELMGDPPSWVLHDLRRTAASGMARLRIAPHVIDRVLSHVSGTIKGISRVYNRHAYLDESAAALDEWSALVEALVRPTETNVIELAASR